LRKSWREDGKVQTTLEPSPGCWRRRRRAGAQFPHALDDLAAPTRTTVRFGDKLPMTVLSQPTPPQQRAFDHLRVAVAP
jgi:hypothetical protein